MATPIPSLSKFPCSQCGLCCQNVDKSDETRFLDRGDGACKHYSSEDRGCGIYERRPDICRVDSQYTHRFAQHYSWDEFVTLNSAVCTALQTEAQQFLIYKSNG